MSEYEEKRYDFPAIEAGAGYSWSLTITDNAGSVIPGLSGATFSLVVKDAPGGAALQDFSAKLSFNAATGVLTFTLLDADTSALKWTNGYYRLKVTPSGSASKVLLYGYIPVDLG